MTPLRLALLALLPGLLAFAPAPFPRKNRADNPDLTGTWEFVNWEDEGKARPSSIQGWRGEAVGEKFNLVSGDGKERRNYTMRLHPSMNPPAIEGAESDAPTSKYYGSYRLRGDELTMILKRGGTFANRPQDFGGKAEHRIVLRRVKK